MAKIDTVLERVTDIRVKVGKIEQHLKDLNGTVTRHETDITSLKKMVYKIIGATSAIIVLIQIFTHYV